MVFSLAFYVCSKEQNANEEQPESAFLNSLVPIFGTSRVHSEGNYAVVGNGSYSLLLPILYFFSEKFVFYIHPLPVII